MTGGATELAGGEAGTELPAAPPSQAALVALLVLGVVCTAAGLVLYGLLVTEIGAGRSLVVTYLNPLIAVGLAIAILGERPAPAPPLASCSSSLAPSLHQRQRRPGRASHGATPGCCP